LTATPQPTEHIEIEIADPRTVAKWRRRTPDQSAPLQMIPL